MKITLTISTFLLALTLTGFSQDSETPLETLHKEYCGCVTRLGNIVGDPVEVMTGCLRIFHLGNPNFAAVEAEAYEKGKGEDISMIETNWQTIGNTIEMAFEKCNYVKKRADASQKSAIKAQLLESRKTAQVEHREAEIAEKVMALIWEDKWDELAIYQDRPLQYEQNKDSLKDIWTGFAYTTDLHTYTTKKETTDDQLVFAYKFYQAGREGIALQIQIRFKADGTFEKVQEIWMGN